MIKKYTIDLLKPKWPKWKKNIANFFLFNIPILHVGKVNKILEKRGHLKAGFFIQQVCEDLGIEYALHNANEIPSNGPVTIVANHPGGADVVGTIAALWDYRHDFKILANELICVEPVVDLVIPVNVMKKENKVDENLIRKAYNNEEMVVFFAAGKNSRYNEKGELKDRRWRSSFLDFANEFKTPILLLHIDTKNTPLFYKVSNFRESKASLKNIPLENIFQLREIFKQKGRKINYVLSELITYETWSTHYIKDDTKTNRILADKLYDRVYSMDKNNNSISW